jgi:hypothetical protein
MYKGLSDIRQQSDSGFINDSIKEIENRERGWCGSQTKMGDARVLDYESELRTERAYVTGFIESLIEQQGLNGKKELLLDDLAYNLKTISASDISIPEERPYVEVTDVPRNIKIFRANQDSKKQFAKDYISRWQMYDKLFSDN